ncbi:hypothetical protein [Chromobacterium paludis]|uniref:Uncharacterized protein n=1 Tax=Chromobacterium paludis TaxID=2605945 RepID=A0A5C1DGC0_9NEIS|nr:hypothetical protein [Chromobacterium paludis]QEL55049.1 hypothetical protein FYK34_05455 [Chromobacterium paludis]
MQSNRLEAFPEQFARYRLLLRKDVPSRFDEFPDVEVSDIVRDENGEVSFLVRVGQGHPWVTVSCLQVLEGGVECWALRAENGLEARVVDVGDDCYQRPSFFHRLIDLARTVV